MMARWMVLLVLLATALQASAAPHGKGGDYLHCLNLDGGRTPHQRCDTVADSVGLMLRMYACIHLCLYGITSSKALEVEIHKVIL